MSGRSSSANTQTLSPASNGWTSAAAKLRISLASGETRSLSVPAQLGEWDLLKADPGFQAQVRGLVVVLNGHSYALTAPRGFRRVLYNVELVPGRDSGEPGNVPPAAIRASYVADVTMATMTVYLKGEPPMVRFDVKLTGKLRWQAP